MMHGEQTELTSKRIILYMFFELPSLFLKDTILL